MDKGTQENIKILVIAGVILGLGMFLGGKIAESITPVKQRVTTKVVYADSRQNYIDYELPKATKGSFKTFMDYQTITDETSKQYALQRLAITDENGLRKFNNKYIVAMGTYYSHYVGKEFVLTLDNSQEINVIVGDIKQDIHTDVNRQYATLTGNVVEFIVDEDKLPKKVLRTGDVSQLGLKGNITRIEEVISKCTNI